MSLKVRIYLDKKLNLDLDLILEKEDAHYLTNVMRLRVGDNVFYLTLRTESSKERLLVLIKKIQK
jgi:16S rRNA U1498 N3-methylase RsmE